MQCLDSTELLLNIYNILWCLQLQCMEKIMHLNVINDTLVHNECQWFIVHIGDRLVYARYITHDHRHEVTHKNHILKPVKEYCLPIGQYSY